MNAFVRIAPLAWVLAACPSLDTPEIRIDGADPEVLPTATELSITVLGAGFGLAGARYSLSEQKGSSAGDRLTAILVGPGNIQTEVTADGVVVESPTRLRLELRRSSAPVPGIYGLQLRRGLTLLAENRVVFELLAAEPVHCVVAGVALPNPASVGLHLACGFREIGVFEEYALKRGRYISSAWFQRLLG